jgi:glucosamine-6-phosphate deaminase
VIVETYHDPQVATRAAADRLAGWLTSPGIRTLMVAGGNSPLGLYRDIASRGLRLDHLTVFTLDDYVGVPNTDPRTCANLLAQTVRDAWKIPPFRFHALDTAEESAPASLREHERQIDAARGLDVIILGLGRNGHLGFNEPGSDADSPGRILELEPVSVEANRKWFGGEYAPSRGVTVGLKTILAARQVLLLAFGVEKAPAAARMVQGPPGPDCPASFLGNHPGALVVLDRQAASLLDAGDR